MFMKSEKNAPKIETVVGTATEMEGNIRTTEFIRVDGKIKGEISAQGVVIGENGVVLGDITADCVTIAGKVKGNISANASLELLPKGQILGDIRSAKLIISDGATFEGNCQMIKADGHILEVSPQVLSVDMDSQQHKQLKAIAGNTKR
jgi:cytoskeletal protein CcmA (bactofilin family)